MAIDYEKLLNRHFPPIEQNYTEKDILLYALGLGLGVDPLDAEQLSFVYEEGELQILPTMPVVMAAPGFWAKESDTGLDWVRILHGSQSVTNHKTLPPRGCLIGYTRIQDIVDKGAAKGAIIHVERELCDKHSGIRYATMHASLFCRGDGGFPGGKNKSSAPPHPIPEEPPTAVCDIAIPQNAALLYRLNGDFNPLHADPQVARDAGYRQPILHGLCTYGIAGHALVKTCCAYRAERLLSMAVRFSAPVYPGETLRTEMWPAGNVIAFRARVLERDVVVLNNGKAELRD